jgi:hypothetical protein
VESGIKEQSAERIRYALPPLDANDIEVFRAATRTAHWKVPPTFCTFLRWAEWRWLDRLTVDMRGLLHTEQEYEYLAPLAPGDVFEVSTVLASDRERRGMRFVTLETTVEVRGRNVLVSRTSFVVRGAAPKETP